MENRKEHRSRLKKEHCRPGLFTKLIDPLPVHFEPSNRQEELYDVVSFLFQAKANFPEAFKNEMLDYYFSFWNDEKAAQLKNSVKPIQLIRFLQVLGAYGFRGLIQRKQHFISSLDIGIENLIQFSNSWHEMDEYPELKNLILQLKSEEVQNKIAMIIGKDWKNRI